MGSTERITFYDQHPFDWATPSPAGEIDSFVSRSLVHFVAGLDSNSLILDVGCGPGRVLGFLVRRGLRCLGLDRSRVSAALAMERHARPAVVGDNLHLPFANASADVVISDGVIHHTDDPAAAFAENCRVLKAGGQMYLGVYKPSGRYPWLYKYPGQVIRQGLRHPWSRPLVTITAQLPYFLVHFIRSKGNRTWRGASNLFYDYFVTPQVAFISRATVEGWCTQNEARILRYDENRGSNVHSFYLVRSAAHGAGSATADQFEAGALVARSDGAA